MSLIRDIEVYAESLRERAEEQAPHVAKALRQLAASVAALAAHRHFDVDVDLSVLCRLPWAWTNAQSAEVKRRAEAHRAGTPCGDVFVSQLRDYDVNRAMDACCDEMRAKFLFRDG